MPGSLGLWGASKINPGRPLPIFRKALDGTRHRRIRKATTCTVQPVQLAASAE